MGQTLAVLCTNFLGVALRMKGDDQAALAHYTEALRLNPGYYKAHYNLGNVLYRQRRYEEAEAHFAEALRLNPGYADAHYNLGIALQTKGSYEAAEGHYAEAVRLRPGHAGAHKVLAGLLNFPGGSIEEAEAHLTEALRANPGDADAHNNLGTILSRQRRYAEAEAHFAEARWIQPGDPNAYNESAMIMAACPEAKFRDGKKAVEFATRACELTQWKNPRVLDTLAAAQAEAADFDAAVKSQERAIGLLGDERQKADYRSRLALYKPKSPTVRLAHGSPDDPCHVKRCHTMVWSGKKAPMQAAVAPVPSPSAGPSREPAPAWDRRTWLVAIPLALIVIYAFLPCLDNGFVEWDDDQNFLDNPYFRGLGPAEMKWAWTTFWLGVYQPLAWLLFETQYVFCQLDPRGYHLTSLLLQVANAVVLYLLTVALLVRCRSGCLPREPMDVLLERGAGDRAFHGAPAARRGRGLGLLPTLSAVHLVLDAVGSRLSPRISDGFKPRGGDGWWARSSCS